MVLGNAQRLAQFVLRQPLHPDEQPALVPLTAGPFLDEMIELLPAAEIEIPDAKIRTITQLHRLLQRGQQSAFNVVEYARHLVERKTASSP